MVAHQAIRYDPAAREFFLHPHEGPELFLFLRTKSQPPVHYPRNAVIEHWFPLRIPPLRQPARLSHDDGVVNRIKMVIDELFTRQSYHSSR